MIQTWSGNGTLVDIETCSSDSSMLTLKVYNKLQDKCVGVSLTKKQLKDLAKFIDVIVETKNEKII